MDFYIYFLDIYDKHWETVCSNRNKPELHEQAKDLIRIEYVMPNETAVGRFAKRLKFKNCSAETMLNPESEIEIMRCSSLK